jgi:CDP-diacylglycerol--glycerol-3-phosphate 3-phosphatidyltransferase
MPSVYDLKPQFQRLLRPSMTQLARLGVTPNHITLIAALGSVAIGALVAMSASDLRWLWVLPLWLLARMALNALDGMMARELGCASDLGAILNEVGDVISDLALYLPLALVDQKSLWPALAFAIGAVLTEFCGLLGRALGASRRYDGPMGKSDRALFIGVLGFITPFIPQLVASWPWIFVLGAALTALTCRNRLARTLQELRAK